MKFRKIVACEKSNELVCYSPTNKCVLDKCKWCLSWIWSDNSLDRIGPASVVARWEGCGGGLGGGRESTLARSRTPHPLAPCTLPSSLLAIGYSNTTSLSFKTQLRNLIKYNSRIGPKYNILTCSWVCFLSHQVSSYTNLKPISTNIFSPEAFITEVAYDLKINKLTCKYIKGEIRVHIYIKIHLSKRKRYWVGCIDYV